MRMEVFMCSKLADFHIGSVDKTRKLIKHSRNSSELPVRAHQPGIPWAGADASDVLCESKGVSATELPSVSSAWRRSTSWEPFFCHL